MRDLVKTDITKALAQAADEFIRELLWEQVSVRMLVDHPERLDEELKKCAIFYYPGREHESVLVYEGREIGALGPIEVMTVFDPVEGVCIKATRKTYVYSALKGRS